LGLNDDHFKQIETGALKAVAVFFFFFFFIILFMYFLTFTAALDATVALGIISGYHNNGYGT